ncbi:MAG: ATP-binding protein [Spirochaetales bacterium]|nr:ATP-binding protein [Spirochaetales bacterium]
MEQQRKLPIGMQTFSQIIEGNYVYVDKTGLIPKVLNAGKAVFLSRPRRFGKSLFVSTLDAYFSGRKELFNGLDIAKDEIKMAEQEHREPWIKYPVINITFDANNYYSEEKLREKIIQNLKNCEEKYDCKGDESVDVDTRFGNLIKNLSEKTNLPVVILIDEYDKALLQVIDNPELLETYKNILKGFYGNLKGSDQYIKFAFITGVTKFSKVSIFSDLNNLNDISMSDRYADICGITKNEIIYAFQPEINAMAKKNNLSYSDCLSKLKEKYDGYHFTPKMLDVYNSFCLLKAFEELDFGNYWFETATPTFLVKAIHQASFDMRGFEDGILIGRDDISDYRLSYANIVPMMYQTGYLTIKDYNPKYGICTLGYPNNEVKFAFSKKLLEEYTYLYENAPVLSYPVFASYVDMGQIDKFMTAVKAIFASIPHPTSQKQYELNYQAIFYLIFKLMGQEMHTEVITNIGRIDAVCETKDYIYLFEFKLNGTVEDALKQIEDKDYACKYSASDKQIVKIGVAFSEEKRNIEEYKII